jgi:hypothetical protein
MTNLVSMVRLREKEHLKSIPTDAHRGAIALDWKKPTSHKVDYAYVNPGYTLWEAIRRVTDVTGEYGNWQAPDGKPAAVGGDLVSVTYTVNDGYKVTFYLTKKQWKAHSEPKESKE